MARREKKVGVGEVSETGDVILIFLKYIGKIYKAPSQ
jgi:hypothetical protein